MAYFTAYFQKKALRFTLSQLGLFDQDAFDLDNQDISWGSTTVIELRDVPLSTTRLTELLQLPRYANLTESRVSFLRLTLPLNFVSNSVAVDIEGVKVKLVVSQDDGSRDRQQEKDAAPGIQQGDSATRSAAPSTLENGSIILPTPDDLAGSFLASQSTREKAEIRSALARSRNRSIREDEDKIEDVGLGPDVSLKAFFANLARGVLDRFKANIKNIQMEVKYMLSPHAQNGLGNDQSPGAVTFCLDVETIDIPSVSQVSETDPLQQPGRRISIIGIHGSLLSTSALSSYMTQLSRPTSPSLSRATSKISDATNSPEFSSRKSKFKNSYRSEESHAVGSGKTSKHTSKPLEFAEDLAKSNRASSDWQNPSSRRSLLNDIEAQVPINFGEDSQALDDSELRDVAEDSRTVNRLGSGLEDSALSESSQSFLCRSPTEFEHAEIDSQRESRESEKYDRSSDSYSRSSPLQAHMQPKEDLTESRIFSAEEAKSIYMSAMSLEKQSTIESRQNDTPDHVQSPPESPTEVFHDTTSKAQSPALESYPELRDSIPSQSQRTSPMIQTTTSGCNSSEDDSPPASLLVSKYDDDSEKGQSSISKLEPRQTASQNEGPIKFDHQAADNTAASSNSSQSDLSDPVKTLFVIDTIQIQLPASVAATIDTEIDIEPLPSSTNLPGAFSTYNMLETSTDTLLGEKIEISAPSAVKEPISDKIAIDTHISNIVVCFDVAFIRLLIVVFASIPQAMPEDNDNDTGHKSSFTGLRMSLTLSRTIFRFEENLTIHERNHSSVRAEFIDQAFSMSSNDLFRLVIDGFHVSKEDTAEETTTKLSITKLRLGFADEQVISFDRNLKMRESVRDSLIPSGQDISVKMVKMQSQASIFDINTAPLHINLNITRLVELVNWLGGLSTVIDLGNSVKSNMTITDTSTISSKGKSRGVHFDVTNPDPVTDLHVQLGPKINIRLGGIAVDIAGKESSMLFEGSALKIVIRDGAIRTQIDRINMYGPLLGHENIDPALVLSIDSLAIAYFDLPKENDLTRLLALLSPSQDREEQDDDILLDTLLKQRRKGGVLRINITKAKLRISRLPEFKHFKALGEEVSQLSSVTKYLPEDDRPGLLILVAVNQFHTETEINRRTPLIVISLEDVQLAMVTFPSLFLMRVGNINASHQGIELVGQATPDLRKSSTRQNMLSEATPKLLLKYIAGEMEPTVRLRIFDLRVEYHVTTIMSFLGISETASGEVIVAEMVNTIASIAGAEAALGQSLLFSRGDATERSQKPFRINVIIRDSIIGLNPKTKAAHGLLVLTKCRLVAAHAEDSTPNGNGTLEINKAAFMVVDDKGALLQAKDVADPNIISGLGTKPTQVQCLEAIGYVSVGQTSAARIKAYLKETPNGTLLDVEVRNDLMVLETCADSTQTLLSVLGGLVPPMPLRKGNKYRTEVVPIEDMLASFSGQAYPADTDEEDDTDYGASSDDETGTIALDDRDDQQLDFDSDYDDPSESTNLSTDVSTTSFGLSSVIYPHQSHGSSGQAPSLKSFHEEAYAASSLRIDDNHFGRTGVGRAKEWNSYKNTYDAADPVKTKESPLQIRLEDIHFIWNLYDGYDWQKTRNTISQAVEDIEAKAEQKRASRRDKLRNVEDDDTDAVIGDMLFNSIYIGISAKDDPRELSRRVNGILNDDSSETGSYATTTTVSATPSRQGSPRIKKKRLRLGRSKHHKMTFEIKGISGNIVSFPPDSGETQSSIDIRVRDLEIFDNVPTSTWKKFATYMHDAGGRQLDSNMIRIEMLVVKPDQDLLASEFVLKVSVLPLRLHVDQDALDFLTRFFEFRDESESGPPTPSEAAFIQRAEVGPVQIKLDFKPKRIDWQALRSGKTSEFMNFIILDEADMILRRIILYGVRGFDKLGRSLNDIWTPDVKANQLPGVLAGLAPVRPLVNVGLGVRDLVVIPMREYKKDGRLVRAVRKGVVSFGKTTSTEIAKLGAKIAIGTHTMLSGAEGLLSPDYRRAISQDDESALTTVEEQPTLSPYADQPIGVVQGLRGAYRGLERDLLLAKDAIVAMPGEVMESQDASGAAAAFLRTAPIVILRPAMGITKAVGQTLMGATNSLDKAEKRRIEDKYKHR